MANICVNRNILLGVVAAMAVAVACAVYFGLALGAAKIRASQAESTAADWKERASETYQRMLFAGIPGEQSAIIPAGTIMDCESEQTQVGDRVVLKHKNCRLYPPRSK